MSNPTVCCICLTKDRPEMLKRAVAAFYAQTYPLKQMIVYDNGAMDDRLNSPDDGYLIHRIWNPTVRTIGALRNAANLLAENCGAIYAHWDSDDYSHPNRLAEQVALLQASGADAVGYNSMLFWDTRKTAHVQKIAGALGLGGREDRNEAWLYRAVNPQHILGTSLLYWRSTWERQPFDDVPSGEDTKWVAKLGKKAVGVSSLHSREMDINTKLAPGQIVDVTTPYEPRMIASVHGGNSSGYAPEKDRAGTKRAPEWDAFCRTVMAL